MIIKTAMYNANELKEIVKLRTKAEGVDLTADALNKVSEVFAVSLLDFEIFKSFFRSAQDRL